MVAFTQEVQRWRGSIGGAAVGVFESMYIPCTFQGISPKIGPPEFGAERIHVRTMYIYASAKWLFSPQYAPLQRDIR